MIAGTVLFVIGSLQMTARPIISFIHDLKLSNYYRRLYKDELKINLNESCVVIAFLSLF